MCSTLSMAEGKTPSCSACRAALQHMQKFLVELEELRKSGWQIHSESSVATDGYGHVVDYWSNDSVFRCKVDMYATHPDDDHVLIKDWKSGKPRDDELQLQVNAICLAPLVGCSKFDVSFNYLDTGMVKDYTIDVDVNAPLALLSSKASSVLQLTINVYDELQKAWDKNLWPIQQNEYCRWCELECIYQGKNWR